jgi:hypothetical protein
MERDPKDIAHRFAKGCHGSPEERLVSLPNIVERLTFPDLNIKLELFLDTERQYTSRIYRNLIEKFEHQKTWKKTSRKT